MEVVIHQIQAVSTSFHPGVDEQILLQSKALIVIYSAGGSAPCDILAPPAIVVSSIRHALIWSIAGRVDMAEVIVRDHVQVVGLRDRQQRFVHRQRLLRSGRYRTCGQSLVRINSVAGGLGSGFSRALLMSSRIICSTAVAGIHPSLRECTRYSGGVRLPTKS